MGYGPWMELDTCKGTHSGAAFARIRSNSEGKSYEMNWICIIGLPKG